ncbi:MAG: Gfo/Idh/MocA family oxidoreductase [Victivallales bacterium]|nr:Gfo/Idh/MocA family oxidoreductase [Victivallales bacterium]
MSELNIGLIGYGKVAHLHAKAISGLEGARLKAVCGPKADKARCFADAYGIAACSDVARMVEDGTDIVVVCTPHPVHASSAVAAANAGAHVIVEKPLASNLADCDKIISSCESAGVMLGTMSQRRWFPPCKRIRDAIDEGKIGEPALGMVLMLGWRDEAYYDSDPWRGSWKGEGGGVLVNQAPHQLDLLLWYMGQVAEVSGCWDNLNHPCIEVEDTALAWVRFVDGGLASILVSNSQKPGIYAKVHIHGRNGASLGVQTDGGAMFIAGMSDILEPPSLDLWSVPGEEQQLAEWNMADARVFNSVSPMEHYHRLQLQDFVDALREGREPAVTGVDGRRTVELITAIYRSQKLSSPVRFPLVAETEDGMQAV